jgi:hypothetical protein
MREAPFETLVPVGRHPARERPDGGVTVMVPRFTGRLTRWVMPLLRSPEIGVRLDAAGTFVWRQCDGQTTVAEIAARVRDRLGVDDREARDRVILFLRRLARSECIQFRAPAARDDSA